MLPRQWGFLPYFHPIFRECLEGQRPFLWRRLAERQNVGSVTAFTHQSVTGLQGTNPSRHYASLFQQGELLPSSQCGLLARNKAVPATRSIVFSDESELSGELDSSPWDREDGRSKTLVCTRWKGLDPSCQGDLALHCLPALDSRTKCGTTKEAASLRLLSGRVLVSHVSFVGPVGGKYAQS